MAMNRAQFKKQLQEGLNTNFGLEYKKYPEQWKAIFDVTTSRKAYEEDALLYGFGAAPIKGEGAGIQFDSGAEAWTVRYEHNTIALAFSITKEAEEDGLYGSLGKKYARALARSMYHTKEVFGANVLNNGHSSGFTGGDGVSLFNTAHPLAYGGTFSNKLGTPADLSETALEDACIAISNFVDDRNLPIMIRSKRLIVPNELMFVAERILGSHYRTGTSDNDINAIYSMGKFPGGFATNTFLTDANAWHIKTDCPDGLKHFTRKGMETGVEGDFDTDNMRYKSRERYIQGWTDPRGAFGSEGA